MSMHYYSFLHYFSFIIYISLIVFILHKDHKNLLNKVCALFIGCFALWALGMTFIHNPEISKEMVDFWYNVNCFGWLSFSFFFYWFIVLFTENQKLRQKKILLFFLFLFPLIFIYQKWNGGLFSDYILMPYGWTNIWDNSFWVYLFFAYYLTLMVLSLGLLHRFYKKTDYAIKRKQAKIIFITVVIILPFGSMSSVFLPFFHFHYFPPLSDVFGLVWILGMVFSMAKYNFLNISSERIAENIIAVISDAVLITDQDGRILNVNQATLDMLKYKEKEIINQSIGLVFTEANFKDKLLALALANQPLQNYNLFFRTKGYAKNIPVIFSNSILRNIDNSIAGIVCVIKNISEIKKNESDLQKKNFQLEENIKKIKISEEKNKKALNKVNAEKAKIEIEKNKTESILSSFVDPVIVVDRLSRISYLNKEAQKVFGFSRKLIGKKYFLRNYSMNNLKPEASVDFAVSRAKENISENPKEIVEEISVAQDGKPLVYKVITATMTDQNNYFGLVKIFHNLTREKEIDNLKSEFISIAAHQLRTPLSAIKWVIKMILDEDAGALNNEQTELLNKGYNSNERIIKLVNDLLYVSRMEEGRFGYSFEDGDYLEAVRLAISDFKDTLSEKNIELKIDAPGILPRLNFDKDRIVLALNNILSNASLYTPANGTIEFSVKQDGDNVKTVIKDNGLGIPAKEQEKLFSKFFRGSNVIRTQTEGSGLGLFITKNIINKHGGSISIESREAKGTKVEIVLPVKKYNYFNT